MNPINNEDKITKSFRNSEAFKLVLEAAQKGEFDFELDEAREAGELEGTSTRLPLLKVTELWSIRRHFSIAEGAEYYKLYKEKFYVENPGSNYSDTVKPNVYRAVVAQKEQGGLEWANAVAEHFGIEVEPAETQE